VLYRLIGVAPLRAESEVTVETIVIKNVRGVFAGRRAKLDVCVRVNRYGAIGYMYQSGDPRDLKIAPSLESKISRLVRRAYRNGQQIVDWTAL
jgi:hypothetical protein